MHHHKTYWQSVWEHFCKHRLGLIALSVLILFCFVGIYAPFFASSRPLLVQWNEVWYFPLFRYLFYPGFFTKGLDIFFNIMMFTVSAFVIVLIALKKHLFWTWCLSLVILAVQLSVFLYALSGFVHDPASDPTLNKKKQQAIQAKLKNDHGAVLPSWDFDLKYMTDYAKLNLVVRYTLLRNQNDRMQPYQASYANAAKERWIKREIRKLKKSDDSSSREQLKNQSVADSDKLFAMPTLWKIKQENAQEEIARQERAMQKHEPDSLAFQMAVAKKQYVMERQAWLERESQNLNHLVMPLIRDFHWEDDAGGDQNLNQYISWWELTRINRKDLVAALIFGIRISLVVGLTAVGIALLIGIPVGAMAGFYGGKFDIIVSRMLEIWEAMPTFFMLLLVVAITQSKSIFLVITVIGIFGWTGFSRYIRGEFFKQRNLSYVEACHALGFNDSRIVFSHILPNAIPPLLTLLPFAIMGAITSEAALSFLGLGEEGSTSWGVLMDEGRSAFPGESYLLWPPAILLVILLVAIALVGDALRDTLDPKMRIS